MHKLAKCCVIGKPQDFQIQVIMFLNSILETSKYTLIELYHDC